MFLLWLRVAAALYAMASISSFLPCFMVRCGGGRFASMWAAWGCSFILSRLWRCCAAHSWMPVACVMWSRCWGLQWRTVLSGVWFYDAISLEFCLSGTLFWSLCRRGTDRYTFPSEGVRTSWLMAHIAALLIAYVALASACWPQCFICCRSGASRASREPDAVRCQYALAPQYALLLDWLPPLDTLERIAHATLEFGFPCMTVDW